VREDRSQHEGDVVVDDGAVQAYVHRLGHQAAGELADRVLVDGPEGHEG
jgi:hypothetical protein